MQITNFVTTRLIFASQANVAHSPHPQTMTMFLSCVTLYKHVVGARKQAAATAGQERCRSL